MNLPTESEDRLKIGIQIETVTLMVMSTTSAIIHCLRWLNSSDGSEVFLQN